MKKLSIWIGSTMAVMAIILISSILVFFALGEARLKKVYLAPEETVSIPSNLAALIEGKRIFQYRGCEACHGEELQGLIYLDNPAIGQVITSNLTSGQGGIAAQKSDSDWVKSIRHGLRTDGTPLLFMPSTEFYFLSDADLGMVIAYIKSAPAVNNEMPPSKLSLPGRIVMSITREITFLPAELIPHHAQRPVPPIPGITPGYGEYLALSCKVCHGVQLSGGDIPGFPPEWPPAPNLTFAQDSRLPAWGESGFVQIIQTGRKHGRLIDSSYMPWTSYRFMTEDELLAVHSYLASLSPLEFGNR